MGHRVGYRDGLVDELIGTQIFQTDHVADRMVDIKPRLTQVNMNIYVKPVSVHFGETGLRVYTLDRLDKICKLQITILPSQRGV